MSAGLQPITRPQIDMHPSLVLVDIPSKILYNPGRNKQATSRGEVNWRLLLTPINIIGDARCVVFRKSFAFLAS